MAKKIHGQLGRMFQAATFALGLAASSINATSSEQVPSYPQGGSQAAESLVRVNNTYRDAIQSVTGTNPSAEEIAEAHPNADSMVEPSGGTLQSCGGTFCDTPARKGRLPESFITTVNNAWTKIKKTMLWRGDVHLGFVRGSFDFIKLMVRKYAGAGVQVFQNFHGLNDTRMQAATALAVQEVREETGLEISAQGTICIEDNVNITIESCLKSARELVAMGHKGFYLKSASGRVNADFVKELVGKLMDEFPDQSIDIHAHETYGEALPAYVAGIEAAVARGRSIGVDVIHPALAGNVAQPSILDLYDVLDQHPDPKVRANKPKINRAAIEADMASLRELRMRYGHAELEYEPELLAAMYEARAAGGASAALRDIPGLEANLSAVLGTKDWVKIQIAVYKMQARILKRLGDPTQVTPYAKMTMVEAAYAVLREKRGKDPLSDLTDATVNYMLGGLGKVPDSVDPELLVMARRKAGLEEGQSLDFIPADQLPSTVEAARKKLQNAGIENPTEWDILTVGTVSDKSNPDLGLNLVLQEYAGTRSPQVIPELPIAQYVPQKSELDRRNRIAPDLFKKIGGVAGIEGLAQSILFLHKAANPPNFPQQNLPPCFASLQVLRCEQAQAEIADFRARAGEYFSRVQPNNTRQLALLNTVVASVLRGKGIKKLAPEIFAPLVNRTAWNLEQDCVPA